MSPRAFSLIGVAVWLWGVGGYAPALAQTAHWRRPLHISVFSTSTQLPGGSVLPLHPGIDLGTELRYNRSAKNQWRQTLKAGVYYHKYSQTGIQLYSEVLYRRMLWQGFSAELKLGGGYLHAISDLQIFELHGGSYQRQKHIGRPQFMGTFSAGAGYRMGSAQDAARIFLDYQFFLQMPFVNNYVPVLPNTALHIGVAFPFFKSKRA